MLLVQVDAMGLDGRGDVDVESTHVAQFTLLTLALATVVALKVVERWWPEYDEDWYAFFDTPRGYAGAAVAMLLCCAAIYSISPSLAHGEAQLKHFHAHDAAGDGQHKTTHELIGALKVRALVLVLVLVVLVVAVLIVVAVLALVLALVLAPLPLHLAVLLLLLILRLLRLTPPSLSGALKKGMGIHYDRTDKLDVREVREMFRAHDWNGDDLLSAAEFVLFAAEHGSTLGWVGRLCGCALAPAAAGVAADVAAGAAADVAAAAAAAAAASAAAAPAAAVADRPPPIRSVLGVAILLLPLSLLCALPFTVVAAALGHSESFCDVLGG